MADESEEERKARRDADLAARDRIAGPLPQSQVPGETDSGDTGGDPNEAPKGYSNAQALTPDLSGAQQQQQPNYGPAPPMPTDGPQAQTPTADEGIGPAPDGAYASDPSDYSRPLRDYRFSGPMPAAGSARHVAEQQALHQERAYGIGQFGGVDQLAAYLQDQNTAPAGYQATGPGQFSPIPGGAADPRMQPRVPINPHTGLPQGMAMLRTANGAQLMPDTPDNRLTSLQHEINLTQLSPSEQMRASSLRSAQSGIQEAVQRGDLSAADGQRLSAQVQEQGQQLWARQGTLQEQLQKQAILQAQAANAHQTAMLTGDAAHMAAEARRTMFQAPNGGWYHINPRTGQITEMKAEKPEKAENPHDMTPPQIASARQHIEAQVRRELHDYTNHTGTTPRPPRPEWHQEGGANEDQIQRQTDQRLRNHLARIGQGHRLAGPSAAQQTQALDTIRQLGQLPPQAAAPAGSPQQAIQTNQQQGRTGPPAPHWWEHIFGE